MISFNGVLIAVLLNKLTNSIKQKDDKTVEERLSEGSWQWSAYYATLYCPVSISDTYLVSNLAGLVTFMICIQKLSGLKLGQDIGLLTEVFRVFVVPLVPADICWVNTLKLGHDRVTQPPFEIIIYWSSDALGP